jgi:hypothetical protein
MRARDKPTRSTDEIVAAIVTECGDGSIEGLVQTLIGGLRVELPPLGGNRTVNEKYAKQLRRRLDKLEATLKAVPEGFPLLFLLTPAKFLPLFLLSQIPVGQDATMEIAPEVVDSLMQEPETRLNRLLEELTKLRAQCDLIIEHQLGEHGSMGYQQERAAIASREVMEQCELPLTVSPTSKYCIVAGLFLEAMTGEDNRDLRRACERMANSPLCTEKQPNL